MTLRRRLWPWGTRAELAERVAQLERSLARARAAGEAHRQNGREVIARLDARLNAARDRALGADRQEGRTKATLETFRLEIQKLKRRKRLAPDERVLQDLLPSRVRAWRPDSAAGARESMLRSVSPAYAAARGLVDPSGPPIGYEDATIAGIRWRVPMDRRTPNRLGDRIVNQGWLPLNLILQTREVTGGGVMIDIGANVGTTAIPRVYLGDASVVYAAEPELDNYRGLVFNVVQNGLAGVVLPDRLAIGASDGTAYLSRAESIGGHRVVLDPAVPKKDGAVPVPMRTLDSWTEALQVDRQALRFVKADTQGSELFVLLGASGILALQHVAWQLEISPERMERVGAGMQDLLDVLKRHFTSFIDLEAGAPGTRIRETKELPEALAYLGERRMNTNILLWHRSG